MNRSRLLPVLILVFGLKLIARPAHAQPDAYHAALLAQLEADHGLTGGGWVFGDTENETLSGLYVTGTTVRQNGTVTGQPFTRSVSFRIPVRGANPWDNVVGIPTDITLAAGDRALLVLWLRGVSAERATGFANAKFEMNREPWTASLESGLIPTAEWRQWFIPFEADIEHLAGQAQVVLHLGIMAQELEIGGITLINYGTTYALDDLPRSTYDQDYEGREPEAAWRAEAEARIEQYRKADVRVEVVDADGDPVPGANVHLRMKRHAFGFGSAVALSQYLGQDADAATFRTKLADLNGEGQTFSIAVPENALKWGIWDSGWPGTPAQIVQSIASLKALGMQVRGHNLVWPGWAFLPADLLANQSNPDYLTTRIEERIAEIAGYPGIRGELVDWDVINEPAHETDLADILGEGVYADWFNQAAAVDPDARLYINEYSIISSSGLDIATQDRLKDIIAGIEAGGGRIDGVGIQGHMSTPLTAPTSVYAILDDYAALGKRLAITEYDAPGVEESLAADYLRDLLTVVFSHPAADAFLMWGFWDGAHWKNDAPIFRRDWSLKPSGQAFFDQVFDAWWTDVSGVAEDGLFETRGFLGDYEVSATLDGASKEASFTLEAGESPAVVRLTLADLATGRDEQPAHGSFLLETPFPMPASQVVTFRYRSDAPEGVRIELFDLLGRSVRTHEATTPGAGEVRLALDRMASGLYVYRASIAGQVVASGRVTVIRP